MNKPTEQFKQPKSKKELREYVWRLAQENGWTNDDVMKGIHDPEIFSHLGYRNKEELLKALDGRADTARPIKSEGVDITTAASAVGIAIAALLIGAGQISKRYEQGHNTIKVRHAASMDLADEAIYQRGMERRWRHPYARCSAELANELKFPFGETMSPKEIFKACSSNWPK